MWVQWPQNGDYYTQSREWKSESQGEEGVVEKGPAWTNSGLWSVERVQTCAGDWAGAFTGQMMGGDFGVSGSRCPTSQIFLGAQEKFQ